MRYLASLGLLLLPASLAVAEAPVVRYVEFEAMVNPITAMRITQAIGEAEGAGDALVLVRLNTPGGLVTSMDDIVQRILQSKVPVAVWVGPAGAHAASAGFVILIAADVAAMAPGTRTGAAHTVVLGGQNEEGDILLKKGNEDVAALVRSIAKRRGRDVEACEKAVFEAKAYDEQDALALHLVDLIAADRAELLATLDGREIELFDGSKVTLELDGASVVVSEFSLRHRFMETLATPLVAYLLFLGGLLGLYVEFTHPGVVFPGVAGALCLLLFALSAQALPISTIGVLLILLALVMFVLEIKVTSYGMLTVGGIVSLLLGSWMLVEGPIPEMRVPWAAIVPTTLTIALLCALVIRLAVRAHRSRVLTGVEALTGEIGRVTRTLDPEGKVFVQGALWNAASTGEPIPVGAAVRVVRVEQMHLTVEPAGLRPARGGS